MIKYELIKKGIKADLYSMIKNGTSVFMEFIAGLNEKDRKKVLALMNFILQQGKMNNPEKYKVITKTDLVEFKSKPYRLLAHKSEFQPKLKYIILSGFKKPTKKVQSRKINQAEDLSKEINAGNAVEISKQEEA